MYQESAADWMGETNKHNSEVDELRLYEPRSLTNGQANRVFCLAGMVAI